MLLSSSKMNMQSAEKTAPLCQEASPAEHSTAYFHFGDFEFLHQSGFKAPSQTQKHAIEYGTVIYFLCSRLSYLCL